MTNTMTRVNTVTGVQVDTNKRNYTAEEYKQYTEAKENINALCVMTNKIAHLFIEGKASDNDYCMASKALHRAIDVFNDIVMYGNLLI